MKTLQNLKSKNSIWGLIIIAAAALTFVLTPEWLEASRLYTGNNNSRYTRKRPKELNSRDSSHHISMKQGDVVEYRNYHITFEEITGPPRRGGTALPAEDLTAVFHIEHLNPSEGIDKEVVVGMNRFGLAGLIQIEAEDLKRSASGVGRGDFYIKWRGAR